MQSTASDRWVSIGLSVLLHAALVGGAGVRLVAVPPTAPRPHRRSRSRRRWWMRAAVPGSRSPRRPSQRRPPRRRHRSRSRQPQPQSGPPPQPTPEELAQREQEREQAEAAAQAAAGGRKSGPRSNRRSKRPRRPSGRGAAQRREAARRAGAQGQGGSARAAARGRRRRRRRSEREPTCKRSLAAEEHARQRARAGPALANWQAQITARIQRAWIRPPSARVGNDCTLYVTQVPGGEVTERTIGDCNGDEAVRESIQAAAYRASPLPPPPDPSLFERNLGSYFKPD